MTDIYVHHRVTTDPLKWREVADALRTEGAERVSAAGGSLFGVWRSQIGRPRDELTVMTVWPNAVRPNAVRIDADWAESGKAATAAEVLLKGVRAIREQESEFMAPTLRPDAPDPPRRQGNYAFRWFRLPAENWEEFLDLCAAAWPGFESSYDSQVIGLWQSLATGAEEKKCLLVTRRPGLGMWERSKMPEGEKEAEVRRMLSRRYDLCDWTCVYTTTLLTAEDRTDDVRWT